MFETNDKEARREECASAIKEQLKALANDGPLRLDLNRRIGDELLRAKLIDPRTFVKWSDETFGRGREWRCTHVTLAKRWDDLKQARTWAEGEELALAALYSVDGALELLRAWDAAMGRVSRRRTRSSPKQARTSSEAEPSAEQSATPDEIPEIKRELKELREEVKHFRIQLPPNIRRRACALADPVSAHDGEAERELRAIACEYKWLFHDLYEDLGGDNSGGPDCAAQHSSSETPLGDKESAASATGEMYVDAPKSEESPSDDAGAEREEGDFRGASIPPAAAPDTLGASPRLEDERPRGDEEVHAAKLGNAVPPMPPRFPRDPITIFKRVNGQVERRLIPVERLPKDRTLIGRQR
jgi:hypothetical protein